MTLTTHQHCSENIRNALANKYAAPVKNKNGRSEHKPSWMITEANKLTVRRRTCKNRSEKTIWTGPQKTNGLYPAGSTAKKTIWTGVHIKQHEIFFR